jgi:hypothetical protein
MSRKEAADPQMRSLAAAGAVLYVLILAPALSVFGGVAIASYAAGAGWSLPPLNPLWLGRAIDGQPADAWFVGMPPAHSRADSTLRVWIVSALVYAAALALMWGLLRLAGFPWMDSGLASKAEIAAILGITHLRAVRRTVRPDLYGRRSRRAGSAAHIKKETP